MGLLVGFKPTYLIRQYECGLHAFVFLLIKLTSEFGKRSGGIRREKLGDIRVSIDHLARALGAEPFNDIFIGDARCDPAERGSRRRYHRPEATVLRDSNDCTHQGLCSKSILYVDSERRCPLFPRSLFSFFLCGFLSLVLSLIIVLKLYVFVIFRMSCFDHILFKI